MNRKISFRTSLLALLVAVCPGVVTGQASDAMSLTEAERSWLQEHPVIRLGVHPAWRPIEFIDEHGDHQGITFDYVQLLTEKLGVRMEIVADLTWSEVIQGVREKSVDLLPAVTPTPERRLQMCRLKSPGTVVRRSPSQRPRP